VVKVTNNDDQNKQILSKVFKQAEDCLLEDMDGEVLVYNTVTAETLHLNGPSAIVWRMCDGERSTAEIIELVEQAFPDQLAQIAQDIENVVRDLHQRQVLELVA
jgi:hypothetical protein